MTDDEEELQYDPMEIQEYRYVPSNWEESAPPAPEPQEEKGFWETYWQKLVNLWRR